MYKILFVLSLFIFHPAWSYINEEDPGQPGPPPWPESEELQVVDIWPSGPMIDSEGIVCVDLEEFRKQWFERKLELPDDDVPDWDIPDIPCGPDEVAVVYNPDNEVNSASSPVLLVWDGRTLDKLVEKMKEWEKKRSGGVPPLDPKPGDKPGVIVVGAYNPNNEEGSASSPVLLVFDARALKEAVRKMKEAEEELEQAPQRSDEPDVIEVAYDTRTLEEFVREMREALKDLPEQLPGFPPPPPDEIEKNSLNFSTI